MRSFRNLSGLLAIGLAILSSHTAHGQLPALKKEPWLGYFAAYQDRHHTLGITADGQLKLTPLNDKGVAFGPYSVLTIQVGIEEVLPDGKAEMKVLKPETLNSEQEPTEKFERLVIQGQVSAEAVFEAVIEEKSGIISIGGRVVDKGKFTKNPIRFAVRAKMPNQYPTVNDEWVNSDPKKAAAFFKRIEDDTLQLTRIDGKCLAQKFEKPVDAASADVSGPGISRIEITMNNFTNRKFRFNASENSRMTLSNTNAAPLYRGFTMNWTPDVEKDKDGKARFSFVVK
jgi:hypothetical protein